VVIGDEFPDEDEEGGPGGEEGDDSDDDADIKDNGVDNEGDDGEEEEEEEDGDGGMMIETSFGELRLDGKDPLKESRAAAATSNRLHAHKQAIADKRAAKVKE
jgi:hypothetical protein